MSDLVSIEKKLDALIDALGFDIDETKTHEPFKHEKLTGFYEITDYKLIKRKPIEFITMKECERRIKDGEI